MEPPLSPQSGAPGPAGPSPANELQRLGLVSRSSNVITLAGLWLVAVVLVLILTFWLFKATSAVHNPYLDILGYLVLPLLLIGGLALCPIGLALASRLRRRSWFSCLLGTIPLWVAAAFLGVSFFVILPILGVAGYHGYEYTESTQFCSNACHAVMEPQATAYSSSPHARVACAECHIGSGASPFVKSKLSGLRQVWAVAADSFQRPIPPAITELRPARDTCEECHWPAKFFGDQLKTVVHFSEDEANTRREVRLLLKTGGADEILGLREGIHMHMLADIEYVATEDGLQSIPWVKYTDDTGRETIYRDDGLPAASPAPSGIRRRLDCMDCHNRGAHKFYSPHEAVDMAMNAGQIDPSLPYVKREVVRLLAADYPSTQTALAVIEREITDFYRRQYPEVWDRSRNKAIQAAIDASGKIYLRNSFPSMRATWKTYPENIGHLESPGCFRCHDGRHVDAGGEAITAACDACHTFLNVMSDGPLLAEGEFHHSPRLNPSWQGFGPHFRMRCDECHSGGPIDSCDQCHGTGKWLEQRGRGLFRPRNETWSFK